jgi:hypothetical protein
MILEPKRTFSEPKVQFKELIQEYIQFGSGLWCVLIPVYFNYASSC